MFVAHRVAQALEEKREEFQSATSRTSALVDWYCEAFDRVGMSTRREIEEGLGGVPWPGARPTTDLDAGSIIVPFKERWESAQDSRAWALEILRGVTTLAVDGSQIAASKEFGVPVSLVQVAWFLNPHDGDRPYVKDVRTQVLTPDDPPRDVEEYVFAESKVNQCRFSLEMETAVDVLRTLERTPPPVVFIDGSLVLSFAGRMPPAARNTYLGALFSVLEASREMSIPLVGYVDLSYASDLMTMVRTVCDLERGHVFDGQVLAQRMGPFDRTAAFQCARGDVLPQYIWGDADHSEEILFVYLQTGVGRWPARIEFPRWILEEGLLDGVIDVIRAEAVVGSGYPYALETADAAAVLTLEDRLAFFRMWQDFAADAGLATSVPGKSLSKAHRR